MFLVVLGVVWVVLGVVLEQVEAVAKPLLVPVLKKPPPGPPKPPPGPPKTPPGPPIIFLIFFLLIRFLHFPVFLLICSSSVFGKESMDCPNREIDPSKFCLPGQTWNEEIKKCVNLV